MLVDGKRSVAELVRLARRQQDELQQILRDLENIGAISFR
jgi:predicted transcriptional regulator